MCTGTERALRTNGSKFSGTSRNFTGDNTLMSETVDRNSIIAHSYVRSGVIEPGKTYFPVTATRTPLLPIAIATLITPNTSGPSLAACRACSRLPRRLFPRRHVKADARHWRVNKMIKEKKNNTYYRPCQCNGQEQPRETTITTT